MNQDFISRDTTLEAARIEISILRKIGMEGRGRMAIELSDNLRATVEAGIRQRHPEYDDNMVKLAALRLAIGEELFRKAYPDLEIEY